MDHNIKCAIQRLRSKAKNYSDYANDCKGKGKLGEATEYYLRAKTFSEAADIVEDYARC